MSNGSSDAFVAAIKKLQKAYGDDVLTVLDDVPALPCIPTGLPGLDAVVGQPGFPRGRIIEFFGRESVGKSLLAQYIASNVQKEGGTVVWLDYETSLETNFLKTIGVSLGPTFLVAQPATMEEGFEIVSVLAMTGKVDLIVLDSVAAMLPKTSSERKPGDAMPGAHARSLSACLQYLLPIIRNTNTVLICINQMRSKIGDYHGGEQTAGGNALKYYCHVRLRLFRKGQIKGKDGDIIGVELGIKAEKNKVGKPFRQTSIKVLYDIGIDKISTIMDGLVAAGIINIGRTGWVESDILGPQPGMPLKIRGTDNFLAELRANSDLADKAMRALIEHGGASMTDGVADEDGGLETEMVEVGTE